MKLLVIHVFLQLKLHVPWKNLSSDSFTNGRVPLRSFICSSVVSEKKKEKKPTEKTILKSVMRILFLVVNCCFPRSLLICPFLFDLLTYFSSFQVHILILKPLKVHFQAHFRAIFAIFASSGLKIVAFLNLPSAYLLYESNTMK